MSLPHDGAVEPAELKEEATDKAQTNQPPTTTDKSSSQAQSDLKEEDPDEVKRNKLKPSENTDKSAPTTQPKDSSPVRKFQGSSRFTALQPDDLNEDDVDEVEIDKLNLSDVTDKSVPRTQPDDSALIRELRTLAKNKPKLVRGKKYAVPGQSIELTSWKMTEWMYTKSPCPFPTLARGLFTRWIPARGHESDPEGTPRAGKDQIVVRGYDKFFNMNEVKWNTWEALEIHTTAPYTLTLKSNGCIIFMAALSPTELIVTSKHSLGEVEGASTSHAQKGEEWLERHLEKAGKTKTEFAKTLFERNLTAVAELCDDSFEEHVLPYSKEMTGLHLHGLNERRVEFSTLGDHEVVAFAKEWGFITTAAITLNTIEEVKKFTDKVSKEGKWQGEAVEGFVVRTKVSDRPPQLVQAYRGTRGERIADKKELSTPPPYAPGSTFFFKIKFEEPYLMYREWRELTKKLLAADKKGQLRGAQPSSYMLRRPETRAYYRWIEDQIQHHPDSLKGFSDGHGIIATRERFLKWCETPEGKAILQKENGKPASSSGPYKGSHKTIIMPVAIPGSGKTAVALAFQHIYGFGHTQSDDVKQKKTGPQFAKNVVELFEKHDVVFADRNNHIRHLRDSLKDEFKAKYGDKGHIIALQWVFNDSPRNISEICASRIETRGENHQSLHADRQDTHRSVISQFLGSFEDVEAEEVDDIVDMEYGDSLEQAVKRAIAGIAPILDLKTPDDHKIREACATARSYTVKSVAGKKAKLKPPRYFALVPSIDVDKIIGEKFEGKHVPDSGKSMWNTLLNSERLASRPHVTLIHVKEKDDSHALWERCLTLQKSAGEIEPAFKVTFDHVVWNGNVMALSVSRVEMHREFEDEHRQLAEAVVNQIPKRITDRLHLTIGTREDGINPFEAASMVAGWRDGTSTDVQSIRLADPNPKPEPDSMDVDSVHNGAVSNKRPRTSAITKSQPCLPRIPIANLPDELFSEVAKYLRPDSLLSLAQCSKLFWRYLMDKNAQSIWNYSIGNVRDLPPCPLDITPQRYSVVLFSNFCMVCGSSKKSQVDTTLLVRFCNLSSCYNQRLARLCDERQVPADIRKLVFKSNVFGKGKGGGLPDACVLKSQVASVIQKRGEAQQSGSDDVLADFEEQQRGRVSERNKQGKQITHALELYENDLFWELKQIQKIRGRDIERRCIEDLKVSREDLQFAWNSTARKKYYQFWDKPHLLCDREWEENCSMLNRLFKANRKAKLALARRQEGYQYNGHPLILNLDLAIDVINHTEGIDIMDELYG